MNMKRIFGIRQVGVFSTILTLDDDCFYHKNKRYIWENILAIKREDDFFSKFLRYPSTTVLLSDGVILRIPTALQEKDINENFKFIPFGNDAVYKYLIDTFESKATYCSSKWIKYLHSSNYIMTYRWLIGVSILFAISILFAVFGLRVNFDFMMSYLIVMQLVCMGSGVFMLAKKHLNESIIAKELKKQN